MQVRYPFAREAEGFDIFSSDSGGEEYHLGYVGGPQAASLVADFKWGKHDTVPFFRLPTFGTFAVELALRAGNTILGMSTA